MTSLLKGIGKTQVFLYVVVRLVAVGIGLVCEEIVNCIQFLQFLARRSYVLEP